MKLATVTVAPLVALLVLGATHAYASEEDTLQIRSLISRTYDRPDKKVEIAPVAVETDYAIADWIQGEMGGRALLKKRGGAWQIVACGGDGMKDTAQLRGAGIPAASAKRLVESLEHAERSVDPMRVRKFGLFGTQGKQM